MTTTREVFYGVISQEVAPYFFMKNAMICSFFGHRELSDTEALCPVLKREIENAVADGCRIFYFGGYGEFDRLCYRIVTECKTESPSLNIKRIYCVPREEYLRKTVRYFKREDYDDVIFLSPSFSGWYKSIYFRNCAMIDESDRVIFYAEDRKDSGAYKAYRYAVRKKKTGVVNLWSAPSPATKA